MQDKSFVVDIEEVRNRIKSIHILNDDKVKNGEVDHIDKMNKIHFFVYPLLGTLGYDVFNPNELKMSYKDEDSGITADVAVLDEETPKLIFRLQDTISEEELVDFSDKGIRMLVITNGLDYTLYTHVDSKLKYLTKINLNNLSDDDMYYFCSLLDKGNLFKRYDQDKFYSDKMIRYHLGDLTVTNYVMDYVNSELNNPSDEFINLIANYIHVNYLETISKEDLFTELQKELSNKESILLNNVRDNKDFNEVNTNVGKVNEDSKEEIDKSENEIEEFNGDIDIEDNEIEEGIDDKVEETSNEEVEEKESSEEEKLVEVDEDADGADLNDLLSM